MIVLVVVLRGMMVDVKVLCPTVSVVSDSCEKHHKEKHTDVRKSRALEKKM